MASFFLFSFAWKPQKEERVGAFFSRFPFKLFIPPLNQESLPLSARRVGEVRCAH
jgi:hypothetical protein